MKDRKMSRREFVKVGTTGTAALLLSSRKGLGGAACAKCSVDVNAVRARLQRVNDFREQHRNVTNWSHHSPTMTRRPNSCAVSRSQRGGSVYVRTVLMPLPDISRKSRSTVSGHGNGWPSSSGQNVP